MSAASAKRVQEKERKGAFRFELSNTKNINIFAKKIVQSCAFILLSEFSKTISLLLKNGEENKNKHEEDQNPQDERMHGQFVSFDIEQ